MKRLLITLFAALLALVPSQSYSVQAPGEGHRLTTLWKEYQAAAAADLPKDQLKALDAIKKKAAAERYAWDYYDAAERYSETGARINWKLRDSLYRAFQAEIEAFDEPVATFFLYHNYWGNGTKAEFLKKEESRLKASHNPEFYSRDSYITGRKYAGVLIPTLANDYDYVLWSCFLAGATTDIQTIYAGVYPQEAIIGYVSALRFPSDRRYGAMTELAGRYEGRAAALLFRERMLDYEFSALRRDKSSSSDAYRALRARCAEFERDRAAFTGGSERLIARSCSDVEGYIEDLDSQSIQLSASEGKFTAILRNVPDISLKIIDPNGHVDASIKQDNPSRSYYVCDTLTFAIPLIDDGEYTVKCTGGKAECTREYIRHSLSIASRGDAAGFAVFVADAVTGEPVSKADLILYNSDDKEIARASEVRLDGFTPLPAELSSRIDNNRRYYYIQASSRGKDGHILRTKQISIRSGSGVPDPAVNVQVERAHVITDRSAFNPGETLHFKAVLFKGMYEYETVPEGTGVRVQLCDSEGRTVAERQLVTNSYGSVAGDIPLPDGCRGGKWALKVGTSQKWLETNYIRVDEFVLPSFSVEWARSNGIYFPGDEVCVTGRILAYAGHSLGGASAKAVVDGPGTSGKTAPVTIKPDGSFEVKFNVSESSRYWHYRVNLTVTDATGETLDFSTYVGNVYSDPPASITLLNRADGCRSTSPSTRSIDSVSAWMVRDDFARIRFDTYGCTEGVSISCTLECGGKVVRTITPAPGSTADLDLTGVNASECSITVTASAFDQHGKEHSKVFRQSLLRLRDSDTRLDADYVCVIKETAGDALALQLASTDGPAWIAWELHDGGNVLLESGLLKLKGDRSVRRLEITRRKGWKGNLSLHVLFFKHRNCYSYTRDFSSPVVRHEPVLEFTRFRDTVTPGTKCSFTLHSDPSMEVAAAVFDKASEDIASNDWSVPRPFEAREATVSYSTREGEDRLRSSRRGYESGEPVLYAMKSRSGTEGEVYDFVEESAALNDATAPQAAGNEAQAPVVRDTFDSTIAWEPFLQTSSTGDASLEFTTSGKLSTYYVQLYAHDRAMHGAVLRRELLVTLPVQVAIVPPAFIYDGDAYEASASISNTLGSDVPGRASIRFFDGADRKTARLLSSREEALTLPAGGSLRFAASPGILPAGVDTLGVLVSFTASGEIQEGIVASDAVFVSFPVRKAVQSITEAHSALLRDPSQRAAAVAAIRAAFVNIDASSLPVQERNIRQMILDAVPERVEPASDNVLSLTDAMYSDAIAKRLGAEGLSEEELDKICTKIFACQCSGGGVAWFEGMSPSPIITAAVLEREAAMRSLGFEPCIDAESAVRFLDEAYFKMKERPAWFGGISLYQYLYARSLYPEVPFSAPSGKQGRLFRKDVRNYLTPTGKRGLDARILAKARRLATLQALASSEEGLALAKSWGLKPKKVQRSLSSDVASLLQYSVEHSSGGIYYPNAVMPFRGLLESELYAHNLLCRLLSAYGKAESGAQSEEALRIAEGIRLWMMIQKETQNWGDDPAFVDACATVLQGTEQTLDTRVLLISGSFEKPFGEIKPAGNGFTVERVYTRGGDILEEGDTLRVGDRIQAKYNIYSSENRSFVRLTAPHAACLQPVQQLSGAIPSYILPVFNGPWAYSAGGYRSVWRDRSEYWFESYPEESSTITEEYFVSQAGTFSEPAVTVESLYAPHYRANDKCGDTKKCVYLPR
ncbi:MAG: hypothetical protein IJS66_00910 [Bacteroidales bacterium]|nr:hypothetical protein [Bacteroidales bacterium]